MTFFEDLHKTFQNEISADITKLEFMNFLFNISKKTDQEYDVINYDYQTLFAYYTGKKTVSKKHLYFLQKTTQWPFDQLLSHYSSTEKASNLLNEFYKLCTDEKIVLPSNCNDLNYVFHKLISYHTYVIKYKNGTPIFDTGEKAKNCRNYIPHPNTPNIISKIKNVPLFLHSIPGMGKTEFVKFVARNCKKYGFRDKIILSYKNTLKQTLEQITYVHSFADYNSEMSFDEKMYILSHKEASSLLIITDMDSDEDTLIKCNEYLSKLNLSVLITVDAHTLPETLNTYRFPHLQINELKKIFTNQEHLEDTFSNESFERLCKLANHHTLTIILLGKIFYKSKTTLNDFVHQFKTHALDDSDFKKYKIKYGGKHCNIIYHLKYAIKISAFTDRELSFLRIISLFNGVPINRLLLSKLLPELEDPDLIKFLDLGIFIKDDRTNSIRMHRIYTDLFYMENSFTNMLSSDSKRNKYVNPSLLPVLEILTNEINSCWEQPYDMTQLQELSFAFYNTIDHHTIRFTSNTGQKQISQEGIHWFQYSLKCIKFYEEYGNLTYANHILDKIPDKILTSKDSTKCDTIPLKPVLLYKKYFYDLMYSWQTDQLYTNNAARLFTDMITYVHSLIDSPIKHINEFYSVILELCDIAVDSIQIYMRRIITEIKCKDSFANTTELFQLLNQAYETAYLPLITLLRNILDDPNYAFEQERYYKIWTTKLNQAVSIINFILPETATTPEKLLLLSDAVYFCSQQYLFNPNKVNFKLLHMYFLQMKEVFLSAHNNPSFILESYGIALVYYVVLRAKYTNTLPNASWILRLMPSYYEQFIQMTEQQYKDLEVSIQNIIADFRPQ